MELPLDKPPEYIGRRWKFDPYLVYHSEMMYERGIFQRQDLNIVQIGMLESYINRHRDIRKKEKEAEFLENLFIEDPKRYNDFVEMQKRAKQAEVDSQIQWSAPQNLEEFKEVLKDFSDIIGDDKEEEAIDDDDENEWNENEKLDLNKLSQHMKD